MNGRTDTASRTIAASPHVLYRAFVDPDALAAWLPPERMSGHILAFDPRPGGAYRLALTYERPGGATVGKTSAEADVVEGRFLELVPGERVVQSAEFESDDPRFAGTMRMTWTFEPVAEGTRVTVRAENVPEGISSEDHAAGMSSSLDNLAAFVA